MGYKGLLLLDIIFCVGDLFTVAVTEALPMYTQHVGIGIYFGVCVVCNHLKYILLHVNILKDIGYVYKLTVIFDKGTRLL